MSEIKTQLHSEDVNLSEIKEKFTKDFLLEIEENLDSIEIKIINLEAEPESHEYISAVYNDIHTIKGLTGLLDDEAARTVTDATESLLDICKRYDVPAEKNVINMVIQCIRFLRKICQDTSIAKDKKFIGEVEQFTNNIEVLKEDILIEVRQLIASDTRIGEILIEDGRFLEEDVNDVLEKQLLYYQQMKFGEIAVKEKRAGAGDVIKAIRTQKVRTNVNDQIVSVPLRYLDKLIRHIEEVKKIHSEMKYEAILRFGSKDFFTTGTQQAESLLSDVENTLSSMRVVTLKDTFQKLNRAVYALVEKKNIDIMFSTVGENIQIDKEIADKMVLPLYELVNLMIDHGMDMQRTVPGSLEVVAYKDKQRKVHFEITNDDCCQKNLSANSETLEIVTQKLKDVNATLKIEDIPGDGCKIAITL